MKSQILNMNRRNFLLGAGAFSIFGTNGCKSVFGREKIKLAVVGVCGKGWSDWLAMYKTGLVEIVALCDADARQVARAQHLTDTKPEGRGVSIDLSRIPFYTDFRRLMDDRGILGFDAMTVSSPDHVHGMQAIRAMKEGIHVYVQKPLVRTLWELDYFNRTAREHGVVTQMGNQGSALSSMRRCTEVVRSGLLGEVKEVHLWTNRPVWPQGLEARTAALTHSIVEPPKGLDWNAWLSVAADRPYRAGYASGSAAARFDAGLFHAFNWRGFFDFGCGAFGDMACHTFNMPFRGLELGAVTSAECQRIEEKNDTSFPTKSIVRLRYPARPSAARPGVTLPACDVFWYDGCLKPDFDRLPPIVKTLGKPSDCGCLLIGTKGVVSMLDAYGGKCLLAMDGDKQFVNLFDHEAAKAVERVLPFRDDAVATTVGGGDGAGAAAVSADGHYAEFIDAIRGEGPVFAETHSRCFSDVDASIPIMESVLVGVMSQRVPGVLAWDSARQRFDNAAANDLMRPFIRRGFEF